MNLEPLLDRLGLDGAVGLDFETFWSDDFTLKKLPTTEYICDPRFATHMCSVQWHDEKRAHVLNPKELKAWAKKVDWSRTALLGHHTHFDGLIASRHYGITPAFYFDTLSMGRAVMPVTVGGSLDKLCKALGMRGKRGATALLNTKNKTTLTKEEYAKLASYAGNDIEQTWALFKRLLPYLPEQELYVIDATIRMYACPRVLIDGAKVAALHDKEVKEKAAVLKRLRCTAEALRSKNSFARLLEDAGCAPPMKQNKNGEWIYAFAKQDLEFKALLGNEDAKVRALVRGRLRHSSSIVEKRAQRMMRRAPLGPQPVYLNYAGALTFRWSGGDKMNWQNFNRGSDLRSAIHAPKGHMLVVADSAQIEARINACFAGQKDVVQAFANKQDVYAIAATKIYGKPIDKKKNPEERFVGKVAVLSLGYQSGPARFAHTLRAGLMGPAVDISDALARDLVHGWRSSNSAIVAGWRGTNNLVKSAFITKTRVEHGCVAYEGVGQHGYMHLPNGMSIRYADLRVEDDSSVSYTQKPAKKKGSEPKRKRLYGGLIVENRTQALSRVLLADWIVQLRTLLPFAQLVMTTHDEIVYCVPTGKARGALKIIERVMTTPPEWMPDLPLAVEAKITDIYDK